MRVVRRPYTSTGPQVQHPLGSINRSLVQFSIRYEKHHFMVEVQAVYRVSFNLSLRKLRIPTVLAQFHPLASCFCPVRSTHDIDDLTYWLPFC